MHKHQPQRQRTKEMSYFTILIHQGPSLSLKPNVHRNFQKQRRKVVVCCCPWSGSGMGKEKNTDNKYQNTTPLIENFKAKFPAPDNSCNSGNNKSYPFPFNFISYILLLGPLSMIINKTGKRQKLPPTPSLLHLIGVSHFLVRSRPHHYPLTELANKYGPLMYFEVGERSAAVISSAKIAREVMSTHDPAYAQRPKVLGSQILLYNDRDVFFHQYDEYLRQTRNLCISELLSSKKVASFGHIREAESSAVIESIRDSGVPFNVSEKIYLYTFTVVCRALFGCVAVDKGEALEAIRKAVDLMGTVSAIDLFPSIKALNFVSWHKVKLEKLRRQLDKMLEGLIDIEHRSRDGEEDFVDVLLRLNQSGAIDYDTVKSLLLDMIVAGTDTSPSVADWAMAELMKNPGVMAKAQDEIRQAFEGKKTIQECEIGRLKYLKLVIMETLRLHPPLPLTLRSCREEVDVDGYHIPLNAFVMINSWAIGRDPTYWKNPENFEPERFEANPGRHSEFTSFGSGRRTCPGKTFGLAQIELILAKLLYHFDWELPDGIRPDGLDMTDVGGIAVSRKTPLYLIAKPYCFKQAE